MCFLSRKWFLETLDNQTHEKRNGKAGRVHVLCLDRFHLLVYFDKNIDGIKESLHYTNLNNQKR